MSALLEIEQLEVSFGGRTRGGARRLVPGREGRDPLPRRRIRLRQVGDRAGGHEPACPWRPPFREAHELRRHGPVVAVGPRDGAAARQSDGDDLPGADDEPQSGFHHRLADGGGADPPQGRLARRGARPRGRTDGPRRHHGPWHAARPVSAPALGRPAPARHDRDGADVRSRIADRRRADHRARRHRAGADPAAARHAQARARPLDPPDHP